MLKPEQVPLEQPIALGRTAEIYAWQEGWILKLFHEWFADEYVRHEARISRAAYEAGLPVPAVGQVVAVGDRLGLIYERVDGPSMLDEIGAKPWTLVKSARLLAELHARMHATDSALDLPAQSQQLEAKIRAARGLSPELREAVLASLAGMPTGNRLCHGDFHPGNVMLTERGPVVIDWMDATRGSPLADVARSSLILLGVGVPGAGSWLQRIIVGWVHRVYVKHYFEQRPGGEETCSAWYPIVAAARMSEGIDEIENWLLSQVKEGLVEAGEG